MTNNATAILTIGGAAISVYALRISGLLLADRLPKSRKLKSFMKALPGTILLSLVLPEVLSIGWIGILAAILTGFCTYRTKNVFLSMTLGVLTVALWRNLF